VANRSYLYSTDFLPDSPEWTVKKSLHGISEYRYDIPLVFKILLSGNPVACRSSIWDAQEPIAIAGDYSIGRANLVKYLQRISDSAASQLVDEALQYLNAPANSRLHFILECGEIFELTKGSLLDKSSALLSEIKEIGANLDSLPIPNPIRAQSGLFAKIFKLKPPDPLSPYYELGLGFWSEILYFSFGENEA